jgi:hypothetical protein
LAGYAIPATSSTPATLSLVAQFSWGEYGTTFTANVTVPDLFGLGQGNWTNQSGSIIGMDCGSEAEFTDTQILTQLLVSSCQGDTQASSGSACTPTLQANAELENIQGTLERTTWGRSTRLG